MNSNAQFIISKTAICNKCRQPHAIVEDSEIFYLRCRQCGNQADQVPAFKVR